MCFQLPRAVPPRRHTQYYQYDVYLRGLSLHDDAYIQYSHQLPVLKAASKMQPDRWPMKGGPLRCQTPG